MRIKLLTATAAMFLLTASAAWAQSPAETEQWLIDELKMKISLPANLVIVNRAGAFGDIEALEDQWGEVTELQENMTAMGIYLAAVSLEGNYELDVFMFEYSGTRQIWDYRNFSEAQLGRLAVKLQDTTELMKSERITGQAERLFGEQIADNMKTTEFYFEQIYKATAATFLVVKTEQADGDAAILGRRYSTMYNGQAVNIVLNVYDGPWTEDHDRMLKQAVDSIVFTETIPQPSRYKTFPAGDANSSWPAVISAAILIAVVIMFIRTRKKTSPFGQGPDAAAWWER